MKNQSLSEVPKKRGIAFPEIASNRVWWPAYFFMKLYFFDFCEKLGVICPNPYLDDRCLKICLYI